MPPSRDSAEGHADRGQCEHVAAAHQVEAHSAGCLECLAAGDVWTDLSLCLSCGWVACFGDSAGGHAFDHYAETDHPIAAALGLGSMRWWCYIHRRAV